MQNIKLKKKIRTVGLSLLALSALPLALSHLMIIPLCAPKKSCSAVTSEARPSVYSLLSQHIHSLSSAIVSFPGNVLVPIMFFSTLQLCLTLLGSVSRVLPGKDKSALVFPFFK